MNGAVLEIYQRITARLSRIDNSFRRDSPTLQKLDGIPLVLKIKRASAKSMNVPSRQADAGRDLRVVIAAPLGDEIGATPPTKSGF